MNSITQHLPFTVSVFKYLSDKKNKKYSHLTTDPLVKRWGRQALFTLAQSVALVAIPLLLIGDVIHYFVRSTHVSDFHRLFSSPLFDDYVNQMKQWVEASLLRHSSIKQDAKVADLVNWITEPQVLFTPKRKQAFHQGVLDRVRFLVREKNQLPESEKAKWIEEFCAWLYTGVHLNHALSAFTLEITDPSLAFDLAKQYAHLQKQKHFNGLLEIPRLYDPHYLGDIPSVLFTLPNPLQTQMIRSPNVTQDTQRTLTGDLTHAVVVEEFRGFLDDCRRKGKVHIYCNLMERQYGSEQIRSSAIEQLEQEYPGTFHVITLDKNSYFYSQIQEHLSLSDTAEFKKTFLDHLFAPEGAFTWSKNLGDAWKQTCQAILDQLHHEHFHNQATLSQTERHNFIEIAYLYLLEAAIEQLQAHSCNVSCRSCIDRGAAFLAEHYGKTTQLKSPQQHNQCLAFALAPAILAQNRLIQKERLDRFISVLPLVCGAS